MRSSPSRFSSSAIFLLMSAALAALTWKVYSDEPPAADKPHRVPIAVLDVAKVFKQGRNFNDQMARLKREIEEFERTIAAKKAEIEKLAPKKDDSTPASEGDTLKMAQLMALLQVDMATKKSDFLKAEAVVYFNTYKEIEKLVAETSRERDIGVVLRINTEEMNPADRGSVLNGVNKAVVYTAIPDLTDDILKTLNRDKP